MKISLVFATTLSSCSMIALTTFGFFSQAEAFSISGRTKGEWVKPIADSKNKFCSNSNTDCQFVDGVGTNSFSWGEAAIPPYKPNQLAFNGNSFSADVDSLFQLGSLEYFNGIIFADTNIERVTLNLDLSFGDNNQVSKLLPITFDLVNTDNTATNIKDPENADYIRINTASAKTSFQLNQRSYQLEIAGFSQSLSNPVTTISAIEGEKAKGPNYLYGRVRSLDRPDSIPPNRDVPEPSTIAGSLLVGMYLISRKKLSKLKATSSDK